MNLGSKLIVGIFLLNTPISTHSKEFFLTGELMDLIPLNKTTCPNVGKVTVLTQPINPQASQDIGGHFGVTSSILRGFKKLHLPMNYNPRTLQEVGDYILVLCDMDALYQAIALKRAGRIKTLIIGPNMMGNPRNHDHILGSPEIDWCTAPSNWTRTCNYEEEPLINGKTAVWYAGIDIDYWVPVSHKKETKTMLVYWKTETESFCCEIENILHKYGWRTRRIRYGSYNQAQYKQLLYEVDAAVFISVSESQGIALAECWAMNVPTLVWNPGKHFIPHGYNRWVAVHSAPYITPYTGYVWKTFPEFELLLNNFDQLKQQFRPRDWVLQYMTDEASIYLLLELIQYSNR